jgi:proteasome accessory factor B
VAAGRASEAQRRLLTLARALAEGRRAWILYLDAGGEKTARQIDLLALSFRGGAWLVAAWCHRRDAFRLFRVDRIARARVLRRRAGQDREVPGFDPRFYSTEGFLEPGPVPPALATIRLSPPLDAVAAALFPAALLERRTGGAVRCHVRATDLQTLSSLVESLGPAAALVAAHLAPPPSENTFAPGPPLHRIHFSRMPARKRQEGAEARLLRLAAWFLDRGEPATREQVCEAFPDDYAGSPAAKEKKFSRDKKDLLLVGIPLRFTDELGETGAYVVDAGSVALPGLRFEPPEAAALWLAGQSALRNHDHPLCDDLEVALRKLVVGTSGLPPRAATLEVERGALEREKVREWLGTLAEAQERRQRVRLVYRRPTGEVVERRVDVYGYSWRRGEWIFVGYDHLRQARRIFLLRRVRSLDLAPADPKKEDYEIPDDFDIRAWSRQEPWDYLVHEPVAAAVRFRGSLARVAARLLPGARVTTEPDNSRVARLDVRNLRGLVRQALAWGPDAEILEPAGGREMAREILGDLASRLAQAAP